jgi:hypothetical protein
VRRELSFNCEDCGAPTTRWRHTGQPLVCQTCGIGRAVDHNISVAHAKAAGWPPGGRFNREQFAAPQRARWRAWRLRGAR